LRAAIGVVNERDVGAGRALAERHPQRVEDEGGAHVRRQLPADDAAAAGVDDEGEEHHALPAAQVGQIGDPQPVGRLDGELALHEIRPPLRLGIGPGGLPWAAAALGPDDPVPAHEALHAAARDLLAGALECLPHAPVAVGVVAICPGQIGVR
jgi:hypothetical protein